MSAPITIYNEMEEKTMAIKIIEALITKFSAFGKKRTGKLDSIELHTIGVGQNTGMIVRNNMNVSNPGGAVHYIVDAEKDGVVYKLLPDDNTAWADAGYGNRHSITVELMESDSIKYTSGANYTVTNSSKFKEDVLRAYKTAVEFFAMKCKEYKLNPTERLENGLHRVYSHNEARKLGLASGHVDPDHIWERFGLTMDLFRNDVLAAMGEEPEEENVDKPDSEIDKWWDFLKKNGFSDVAAAGIMGNIRAESNFIPTNLQDSFEPKLNFNNETYTKAVDSGKYNNFVRDGAGYGFVQWTYWSRKAALLAYAKNKGVSIGDADMQREFFLAEIKNYTNVIKTLETTTSIREASDAVLKWYEQPADQSESVQALRSRYSSDYYNKYHKEEKEPVENVKYVVQCGLFSIKANAEMLKLRLERSGFDAVVKSEVSGFRVQAGVFSKKENAENLVKVLKGNGFDAIIKETY